MIIKNIIYYCLYYFIITNLNNVNFYMIYFIFIKYFYLIIYSLIILNCLFMLHQQTYYCLITITKNYIMLININLKMYKSINYYYIFFLHCFEFIRIKLFAIIYNRIITISIIITITI